MQIALNPQSGFPFAEVAAAVAAQHPHFAVLLIAKLQQVSFLPSTPCPVLLVSPAPDSMLARKGRLN